MLEVNTQLNNKSFSSVETLEKQQQVTVKEDVDIESKALSDAEHQVLTDAEQFKDISAEAATSEPISTLQMEKVAQQLQEFVGRMNKSLEFHVDEDSGKDVIKVVDKNNGELIKQFPSEEVLTVVARLSEAAGMFINSKV